MPDAKDTAGPASSASELGARWRSACECCDTAALLSLYEEQALLVAPSGEVIQGRQAMQETVSGLLTIPPSYRRGDTRRCLEADDIALLVDRWAENMADNPASERPESGFGLMVVRRQADSSWLICIDVPYGTI